MSSLGDLSRAPWIHCSELLRDAALFVDQGTAELLHWAGGIAVLPQCTGVYDLYAPLGAVARDAIAKSMFSKVVFVVSTFLSGRCSQRVSVLLSELQPLACHVLCSQSERCHALHLPLTSDPAFPFSHYGEFQALIRKWLNRESGVRVSVQHLPVFHSEVCPGLLITPPFASLFPPLYQCLPQEVKQAPVIENLSHELQTQIKSFVSGMDLFLSQLDAKEEIFSLGYFSAMISKELCVLPDAVSRRKTSRQRCSLLLVDRTLDLTTPASHCLADGERPLGDRLLAFPPLAPGCSDVAVSLAPLSESPHSSCLVPGSLAQPLNKAALQLLKTLMTSRRKECLMELSRLLLEAIAKEHLDVKLTRKLGRPSAQQLRGFLEQFKGHSEAIVAQHSLLQLACAVLQSLEGEAHAHWELLCSVEKVLMLALSEGGEGGSVAVQLCEVVGGRGELGVCELLGVAVSLYALAGPEAMGSTSEEQQLKEALAALLLKRRSCDEEFANSLGIAPSDSQTSVFAKLEPVFQRLHALHHPVPPLLLTHDALPRPLMQQLGEALFDPASPHRSVFQHHPLPQAGLLQSGFSYLKSQPRPEQSPLLLVFVVGGVTCSEVKALRDTAASHRSQTEVLVGGTRLQSSVRVTRQLLLCGQHC